MKIKLLCIGKLKDSRLASLEADYLKKLKHDGVERIQLPDGKSREGKNRLQQEAIIIRKTLHPGDVCVLLDEKGKSLSSLQFSHWIQTQRNLAVKALVFVLGSSHGTSPELKTALPEKLALGPMTLPHELARVVFLEQLYRAFSILRNTGYHHY
jgi:23S rRNA (pseudouridine1915-N3)-methyltransferase